MLQIGCRNIFRMRRVLHQKDANLIASLNSSLIPINLMANILLMIKIYRARQLDLRSNRLYFCLAMSFFLSALLVQPTVTVLFSDSFGEPSCLLEMLTHYSSFLFSNVSSFVALGIGLDQLVQHIDLFWYKYALTRSRVLALFSGTTLVTCMLISVYIVATCYGKFAVVNSFLSSVIFTCATTLALRIERVRSNQIRKVIYLRTKEMNLKSYQYHKVNSVTLLLACTAINSMLFATAQVYIAVNGLPRVIELDSFARAPLFAAHPKHWPSYLLYIAIVIQPLNGTLFAVVLLYRNRRNFKCLVNTFKLLCHPSNKQMPVHV